LTICAEGRFILGMFAADQLPVEFREGAIDTTRPARQTPRPQTGRTIIIAMADHCAL
jgi:hypothetical protein